VPDNQSLIPIGIIGNMLMNIRAAAGDGTTLADKKVMPESCTT